MRVFVAGPIDFQDIDELIDYRLRVRDRLQDEGHVPVDQYSEILETVGEMRGDEEPDAAMIQTAMESIPNEPFLRAAQHAIAETSLEEVMESPDILPEHTPESVIDDLVERDLSLLDGSNALLAFLPEPSCGTMAELIHAHDNGIPTIVISERPPHYVQHYADRVEDDLEQALETLETVQSADGEKSAASADAPAVSASDIPDRYRRQLEEIREDHPDAAIEKQRLRCDDGCDCCPHGPYYFAVFRDDGRKVRRYLGPGAKAAEA